MDAEELQRRKNEFLDFIKKNKEELKVLELKTRGQSGNPMWKEERSFRLTASRFGEVCKLRKNTNPKNMLQRIIRPKFRGSAATQWGQDHEEIARKEFEIKFNVKVKNCGLFILEEYPYLGASPDGILDEESLIEIKCPYAARTVSPEEAVDRKMIKYLQKNSSGNYSLKKTENYFFQVQGQLAISERRYCYFVVWTPLGMLVEKSSACKGNGTRAPLASNNGKKTNNKTNISKMQKHDGNNLLKYVSLVTLTLQNAVLGLSMRYARTREGDMFLSSTAVLMSEVVKFITCIAIVYVESGGVVKLLETLDKQIIRQPMDTLKVCVPSFVYLVQNNLLYLSASHLDAATYQVTYQLKILTTAMFAVFILKKQLLRTQWLSLMTLIVGVVLVQLAQTGDKSASGNTAEQNRFIGFMAALAACVLSGFAGIYFEKILKGSDVTVWMRNVQLSFCSIPFGLISCYAYDGHIIQEKGFFFGYDKFVNYLVVLQAVGGLLVAVVVKYADNILKGFATSLAIVISCIASIYIFNFVLSVQFAAGAAFVIFSIFLYGHTPKKPLVATGAFKV